MTVKEVWEKSTQFLKDKHFETPRLDAELLISKVTGLDRVEIFTNFERPLKEAEIADLRELIKRRSQGEPVAYLLGSKPFYKSTFMVSPATLIPRPETELLVERAISFLKDFHLKSQKNLIFLELGSGSGCIVNSILHDLPFTSAIAVEKSPEAAEITRANAHSLGVSDRLRVICDDADLAFQRVQEELSASSEQLNAIGEQPNASSEQKFSAIVSNPPYISSDDAEIQASVIKYEPHMALFAESNGEALLRSWAALYSPLLCDKGLLMMEMGSTQGHSMKCYIESFKFFDSVNIVKDYSGHDRFIEGIKNG